MPASDVFVSILMVLCLVGFTLNLITLLIIFRLRNALTAVLLLTLGLAAADLWASTIVAVGLFLNNILPILDSEVLNTDAFQCLILVCECFKLGAVVTSICYLVLLAVCHYLAIVFPVDHSVWMSKQRVKRLMTVVIVIPPVAILVFLRLISPTEYFGDLKTVEPYEPLANNTNDSWNSSRRSYRNNSRLVDIWLNRTKDLLVISQLEVESFNDTGDQSTGVCWSIINTGYAEFIFRGSVFCVVFLIPFILLATMYLKMALELSRTQKAFRRNSMARLNSRRKLQRKRRTVLTTMLMIVSFVVGWLPSTLVFVSTSREFDMVSTIIAQFPTVRISVFGTVNVLMMLKFSVNPVIYALRIPSINRVVKSALMTLKLIKAKSLKRPER